MFTWETLRASSKCNPALERKKNHGNWKSGEDEKLNSQLKVYSDLPLLLNVKGNVQWEKENLGEN